MPLKIKYLILSLLSLSWQLGTSARLASPEPKENEKTFNLRYLIFGTSVSWGARIENRYTEAYPYVLSPNVMNLSMRASDPSYPSMCTQSMVENSVYDVIIIEYDRMYRLGLSELTHRLRRRFPDAVIILVKSWCLMNVNVKIKGDDKPQKLRAWLSSNGFEKNREDAHKFIANVDSTKVEFSFDDIVGEFRDNFMEQLSKETGASIYSWDMKGDIKELLVKRMPLFHDFTHWNKIGHEIVASEIQEIINKSEVKHCSTNVDNNKCKLGDWGEGDVCSNWLESSNPSSYIQALDKPSFEIDHFDVAGSKYAIPFPEKLNHFRIRNPFHDAKYLSLTYMATDNVSKNVYPKVKISINGNEKESTTVLEPWVTYTYPLHVQKTTKIGVLNPGWNDIELEMLNKSEKPFRLVGFSITDGKMSLSKFYEQILEH